MRPEHVERYLERIGASTPVRPTREALAELAWRHLESVPFENIGIHLGEPASLDEDVLFHKIVDRRRGGLCYELNGLFAALLHALGFEVDLLAARVWRGNGYGPPMAHLALRVNGPVPVLVDVGFGNTTVSVVPWEPASGNAYVLRPDEHGDMRVYAGDELLYSVENRPRELTDFLPTWWWLANSPDAWAGRTLFCTRAVPGGRRKLSGDRLIDITADGSTETVLTADQVLDCYRDEFGIPLTEVPTLRQNGR